MPRGGEQWGVSSFHIFLCILDFIPFIYLSGAVMAFVRVSEVACQYYGSGYYFI